VTFPSATPFGPSFRPFLSLLPFSLVQVEFLPFVQEEVGLHQNGGNLFYFFKWHPSAFTLQPAVFSIPRCSFSASSFKCLFDFQASAFQCNLQLAYLNRFSFTFEKLQLSKFILQMPLQLPSFSTPMPSSTCVLQPFLFHFRRSSAFQIHPSNASSTFKLQHFNATFNLRTSTFSLSLSKSFRFPNASFKCLFNFQASALAIFNLRTSTVSLSLSKSFRFPNSSFECLFNSQASALQCHLQLAYFNRFSSTFEASAFQIQPSTLQASAFPHSTFNIRTSTFQASASQLSNASVQM
jgi:hypothetical protein